MPGHRDPARRTRERIGLEVPRADAVRQPVARSAAEGRVRAEERPGAVTGGRAGVPIDPPAAHGQRRADRIPRGLGDHVHGAGHRVRTPRGRGRTADHLDLLYVARADRQRVPHDHPEEVEVDAAPVHQHELRVRQHAGRVPAGDLHIPGRELDDVQTRHRAQHVADVGARRSGKSLGRNDRRGDRRIDHPHLGAPAGGRLAPRTTTSSATE